MHHSRRRVIIIRRGAIELFQHLRVRYVGDAGAEVIWDRRATPDRRQAVREVPVERRGRQRRIADSTAILHTRGFFAARMIGAPDAA
jgi:hypothetical protein